MTEPLTKLGSVQVIGNSIRANMHIISEDLKELAPLFEGVPVVIEQVKKEDLKKLGPQFEQLEARIDADLRHASNAITLLYEVYSETQGTFVKDGTYKLTPKLKQTIDYFLFNGFMFPKERPEPYVPLEQQEMVDPS